MKFTILLLSDRSCCLVGGCVDDMPGEGVEVAGIDLGGGTFSVGSDPFDGTLRGDLNRSRCFASETGAEG